MPELEERLERLARTGVPRGAATVWRAARAEVDRPTPAPLVGAHPRRPRPAWLVVTGALVVVALAVSLVVGLAGGRSSTPRIGAPVPPPPGSIAAGDWTSVSKGAAGLGAGTVLSSLASNGGSLLVGGERETGPRTGVPTIWWSGDGFHWAAAREPATSGSITAIATHGNEALAVGRLGGFGNSTFVWRSSDGGRSWSTAASAANTFGAPVPTEGRPDVAGLLFYRGSWIAYGGGSDGYEAIWTSRDGSTWTQVLKTTFAGAATVVPDTNRGLFAYWFTLGWFSSDGTHWAEPERLSIPDRLYLGDGSVAAGVSLAAGQSIDRYDVPTPLLRSGDQGRTWVEDPTFLRSFPTASVLTIVRAGTLWIATGTSGSPNHPDAWVSRDTHSWEALPPSLYVTTGGMPNLAAALKGRVVILAGAPALDRYYVYDNR